MKKHSPTIEWHILDEDADERYASTFFGVERESPEASPRRRRIWAAAGLAALLLLLMGGWLLHRGQTNIDRLAMELQDVTEAEIWLATNGKAAAAAGLVADPSVHTRHEPSGWESGSLALLKAAADDTATDVDIDVVDLYDEQAVVQTTIVAGDSGDRYRQLRFYKLTAEGWRHTAPSVEWWGAKDQSESTYFVFEFRGRDAGVVADIVPKVDAMYAKMRRDLGLVAAPAEEKPVVEISPAEAPGAVLLRSDRVGHWVVPSPALYLAPVSVSDADLVLQSLALLLSHQVVGEAVAHYQMYWVHDEDILSALRLWMLWDLDLPLADWREEVVQWRLGAMQIGNPSRVAALPRQYEELCAIHSLWLPSPALVSIPLTCTDLDRALPLSSSLETLSATRLEQLTAAVFWQDSYPGSILRVSPPWAAVLLATLFEYIASSYGPERLPDFLAGLGHYRGWPALSSAVFGAPSGEFAAGWHAYLVEQYRGDSSSLRSSE